MSRPLTIPEDTLAAQQRAADPRASSWASANAGAGKTHVLTTRVARLLLAGTDPSRILCVTFTKAAAAEMTNRLFARLGEWSTMEGSALREAIAKLIGPDGWPDDLDDLKAARRLFARALETPGGLKIQTIHAFAQSVLTRFPLEAGIAPGFQVVDEGQAEEIRTEARDGLLNLSAEGTDAALSDAITLVSGVMEETGFDGLLREVLQERLTLEPVIGDTASLGAAVADLHAALSVAPDESEERVLEDGLKDPVLPAEDLRRVARVLLEGSKRDKEQGGYLSALLSAEDRAAHYGTYRRAFFTSAGKPKATKSLATKASQDALPTALGILLTEQERVIALEERMRAVRCARYTRALLVLANRFLELYAQAKQARGVLDYDDLIAHTRGLLATEGAGAWIHYKLDAGIDHILVDEAQDTSPAGWDIIRRLADEFHLDQSATDRMRTIFAVGDEKQSIYSFQGAEPAGFGRMKSHFEQATTDADRPWKPVALHLSFRSAPEILQAVDLVFSTPETSAMVSADATAIHHQPLRKDAEGLVEVWPVITPEEEPKPDAWTAPVDRPSRRSPPTLLARRLADQIGSWLRDKEWLANKKRPVRPGDILILVRRRNQFVDMVIRELKQAGVPVAGSDRLALTDHLAVMDLIAIGRFALLPEDDLTLATVLKSPFIGFTEDALFDLAHGRDGTLWAALQAQSLSQTHCAKALAFLEDVRVRAQGSPAFEFYAWLLGEGGGRKALVGRLGPDALDPIEEFVTLAETFGRRAVPDLTGFLHGLEREAPVIKRDMEADRDQNGPGEVRIMTVHGAKGLEAPIVILPDTCTLPDAKHDPRLLIEPTDGEDRAPLALWPQSKGDDPEPAVRIRDMRARKREAEYRRLLYVAMTRAEDRLYVCGYQGKHQRPDDCWHNLISRALTPHADTVDLPFGEQGLRLGRLSPRPGDATETVPDQAAPPGVPEWLHRRADEEPGFHGSLAPSQLASVLEAEAQVPALAPAERLPSDRFQRGRLVHKLLQVLPDLSSAERRGAGLRYLAHPAHGLEHADQESLLDEVLGVMKAPAFAALYGPESRAEVPIAGHIPALGPDLVIEGQIDRLVVTPDLVQIVDYKTNRPAPDSLPRVAGAYIRQMALYRGLLRSMFPDRTTQCILLWTAGPRAMILPESVLDSALNDLAQSRSQAPA